IAALSGTYINISGADASGYYLMVLQSNLTYTFQVGPSGYESQYKSYYFGWGDNLTVDFLMEPTNCTLSGFVKDTFVPLGSASVRVHRLDDPFPIEYNPRVNASTGYFETNLTRGVWQVEVRENGYYAQTLTVIMENGKTTWQNFTLRSTPTSMATVQGYIRYYNNGSGVPFEAASADNANGTWNTYNFTDATGWYSLSVIPGDITISAWASGYDSEGTQISVAGGVTYWLNHTISEPVENSFIDGYVTLNGTGKPGVRVVAAYSWRSYEDMTDPSGYYNISVIAAPLEVQAIKDGYTTAFHQVDTISSQTMRLNMTIETLDWSTEIRGYINNETGGAVENAYVSFDYDGWGDASVTTAPDYTGLYQRMAPSGNATYFIVPNDHEYKQGDITFPPDQLYWFSKTLTTVKEEARIICRLTDIYTGKPLKHMGLSIRKLDLDWWKDVETDTKGNVKTDVPSGFVQVNFDASSNGYQNTGTYQDPSMMQFLIKPGETRWLNISLFPRKFSSVIHGIVNDTLDNPIPGATVYVRYGDTIATNITDGTGYYEVSLPGDHPVEIWARTPT
ncbi:MAG: carboxypeptidase regulatory-like domain-containing protein, partial [Gammaproteobacteria bacterium]|nr:carboxypeptidase regulatory-like domain-containing protein [Gammaproteobacteria bacterium]